MPTTAVDNLDTRMMSKWPPISIKTLEQCMETLAKNLRAAINMKTGKSFGLMFDDNCSVNQKIATLLGWMRSHRLNLEVNRFLADYETEFVALNNLLTS
ncbi:hypothetical protein L916_02111 [Phytophthora nicotianae]|uniref:Uncharacterized protein n=1 Tax=Phytophthora nicotianae TaxID=4792 RepID=W2JPA0_PHYNI|nr:hypothetical protein L916_02111 [Phytophthora nicotianae]